MSDQWLTPTEAGKILGVNAGDIRRMAGRDQLVSKRNGRSWLYTKSSVEAVAAYRESGQAWRDSYKGRWDGSSPASNPLKPCETKDGKTYLEAPGPTEARPRWDWKANL